MTVEIVPPGQREEPDPEVTLEEAVRALVANAKAAARHIAVYPPRKALVDAAEVAHEALARHEAKG